MFHTRSFSLKRLIRGFQAVVDHGRMLVSAVALSTRSPSSVAPSPSPVQPPSLSRRRQRSSSETRTPVRAFAQLHVKVRADDVRSSPGPESAPVPERAPDYRHPPQPKSACIAARRSVDGDLLSMAKTIFERRINSGSTSAPIAAVKRRSSERVPVPVHGYSDAGTHYEPSECLTCKRSWHIGVACGMCDARHVPLFVLEECRCSGMLFFCETCVRGICIQSSRGGLACRMCGFTVHAVETE